MARVFLNLLLSRFLVAIQNRLSRLIRQTKRKKNLKTLALRRRSSERTLFQKRGEWAVWRRRDLRCRCKP